MGEGELELWYEHAKGQPLTNSWLQTGVIASTVANYAGRIATKFADAEMYCPIYRDPQTPAQLEAAMLAAFAAGGIEVIDTRPKEAAA